MSAAKQFVTWQEVDAMAGCIARKVKRSRFRPEVLIGISRGGLVPVRLLGDHLDLDRIGTMRVKRYGKKERPTSNKPVISQRASIKVKGRKVLLVDDVADKGHSLNAAIRHLRERGAAQIEIATLHFKLHSVVKPRFYAQRTNPTTWLVYPWEREEHKRIMREERRAA